MNKLHIPSIKCPNCNAALVMVTTKEQKNSAKAEIYKQGEIYDCVDYCNKCKKYIGIRYLNPNLEIAKVLNNKITA